MLNILILTSLFLGCEQGGQPTIPQAKKSEFRVSQHYSEFTSKMENYDTLNIEVNLSICQWSEYDQLQITKFNDSVFIQLKEKSVMYDEPLHFTKVFYKMKSDTLNLEKMMTDFEDSIQSSSPFFVLTNPKERDTINLNTTGLGNREFMAERYRRIMLEFYPEEMNELQMEFRIPPQLP
ncbi:hypothetical protein [Brumimicrobium mesophilum]|uniref:hypothetical protein n=1 Tax=Brumimicrobium mesophilum TaxID=392717 RepID=UPI00131E1C93|nr:hypothetical protein [Brumimicrobium mesophilum]